MGAYLLNQVENRGSKYLNNNSLINNTAFDDLPDMPIVETDSPLLH